MLTAVKINVETKSALYNSFPREDGSLAVSPSVSCKTLSLPRIFCKKCENNADGGKM